MNNKLMIALLGLLMISAVNVSAEEVQAPVEEPTQVTEPAAEVNTGPVEVGNKICPVSKEKVGEMGPIVQQEYNGKIYNFCCKMCLTDFNKDPEKYVAIVEEELAKTAAESAATEGAAEEAAEEGQAMDHDHAHQE